MPRVMKRLGYRTHAVGKWDVGFYARNMWPTRRGFDTYFGYLGGGEDYLTHKSGQYVDLTQDSRAVLNATGQYSTELFANVSIARIAQHAAARRRGRAAPQQQPLFC